MIGLASIQQKTVLNSKNNISLSFFELVLVIRIMNSSLHLKWMICVQSNEFGVISWMSSANGPYRKAMRNENREFKLPGIPFPKTFASGPVNPWNYRPTSRDFKQSRCENSFIMVQQKFWEEMSFSCLFQWWWWRIWNDVVGIEWRFWWLIMNDSISMLYIF